MTMTLTCAEFGCHRTFVTDTAMAEHAAVVHFNEIRSLVEDACKDLCETDSCYVSDMTTEYVVFECYMEGEGYVLYQCTYSIADDNTVTLGECSEVIRIVTYEPKPEGSKMSGSAGDGMGGHQGGGTGSPDMMDTED